MFKFIKLSTVSMIIALVAGAAQASVFVWQDPASDARLSFPDSWKPVNNQNPGDVLTIRAPGENDFAQCRLNVQPEDRFKIYPVDYSPEIQRLNVSKAFWEKSFDLYDNVVLDQVADNAGLGRGFGSWATASYETTKGAKMFKRSMAYASYYNNHIYTVECSAEQGAYDRWHNPFLTVVKSVDFKKTTNHAYTGYYRDFLSDKTLKIRGATVLDDTYH